MCWAGQGAVKFQKFRGYVKSLGNTYPLSDSEEQFWGKLVFSKWVMAEESNQKPEV